MSKGYSKSRRNKGQQKTPPAPPGIKQQGQASAIIQKQELTIERQGPIPDADELALYEQILPGAADRIVKMTEVQIVHRHEMEKIAIQVQSDDVRASRLEAKRGQICGLVAVLSSLIITGVLGWAGQEIAASVLGGGSVASLASAFFVERWRRSGKKEK